MERSEKDFLLKIAEEKPLTLVSSLKPTQNNKEKQKKNFHFYDVTNHERAPMLLGPGAGVRRDTMRETICRKIKRIQGFPE